MLKENKREEITKNIEKGEALVEQVADGIWRIGVELPQNPLRKINRYFICRLRFISTIKKPSSI